MRALYPDSLADAEALNPLTWYNLIGAAGCLCWIGAYILIIRRSHRDAAYGLPIVAICLNFGWEFLASFVVPNPVPLWHFFDRAWLVIDVIILYQLFRHGPALQKIPEVQKYFYAIVITGIVAGAIGQYTFISDFRDRLGLIVAFLINLVMSAAFIGLYFERRPEMRGISVGPAS